MSAGFFSLFDDIAALMDDVATMSKYATKKTAGILADDLAVNAEKASGFVSSRELPVLWKITKGSFLNKLIILPIAFLLSALLPAAVVPILIIGGIYLAYEGTEKVFEYLFHRNKLKNKVKVTEMTEADAMDYEKKKIRSAILVDFILSIEIVIIALGTVVEKPLPVQVIVVSMVALMATIGVYGLVALLVRIDDLGFKMIASSKGRASLSKSMGIFLVKALPVFIKSLTVIGTIAMILVAGGIFVHNINFIHKLVHTFPSILAELAIGITIGAVTLLIVKTVSKITLTQKSS